jgi:hypothetical protein
MSNEDIFQCIFESDPPNTQDQNDTQQVGDSRCCGVFSILVGAWGCQPKTPKHLRWMLRVLAEERFCSEDGTTYPKHLRELLSYIHQRVEIVLGRNGHFFYRSIELTREEPRLVKMDSFFQNVMNGETLIDVVDVTYIYTRMWDYSERWRIRDMSMVTEYTLIVIYRWVIEDENVMRGHVFALKQVGGEVLFYDQYDPGGVSIGLKLDAQGKMFADTQAWQFPEIPEGAWVSELHLVKTEGDFFEARAKKRRFFCARKDEVFVASVRPRRFF